MNILKNIIKYLSTKYLTESEISGLLINKVDYVKRDKKEDDLLFNDLKSVEGFVEYLTNFLYSDRNRYFNATTPMEQLMIKGAYNRIMYLRSKLVETKSDVKLTSPRHK